MAEYNSGNYKGAFTKLGNCWRICHFEEYYYLAAHCLDMAEYYEHALNYYQKSIDYSPHGEYSDRAIERIDEIENGRWIKKKVWVSTFEGAGDSAEGYYTYKKMFEYPESRIDFPDSIDFEE